MWALMSLRYTLTVAVVCRLLTLATTGYMTIVIDFSVYDSHHNVFYKAVDSYYSTRSVRAQDHSDLELLSRHDSIDTGHPSQ